MSILLSVLAPNLASLVVQLVGYRLQRHSRHVLVNRLPYERCRILAHDVLLYRPVYPCTRTAYACCAVLLGVLVHTSINVLQQLSAVVLSHGDHKALDEHTIETARRNVLRYRYIFAVRLTYGLLGHRQHVRVMTQTLCLSHDERMRPDFRDHRQHQLGHWACVRGAGYGRVLILPHDVNPLVSAHAWAISFCCSMLPSF